MDIKKLSCNKNCKYRSFMRYKNKLKHNISNLNDVTIFRVALINLILILNDVVLLSGIITYQILNDVVISKRHYTCQILLFNLRNFRTNIITQNKPELRIRPLSSLWENSTYQ